MKKIIGYEGRYGVTTEGTVHNLNTGRVMKQHIVNGYKRVSLTDGNVQKHHRVHRLVAIHFLPNPDNLHDVDHIDEDKGNNTLGNLQWMSRQDNTTKSSDKMRNKSVKVPIKIDGLVYESLLEGAKYLRSLYPNKQISTIKREFRRINSGARKEGLMYGHKVERV